VLIGETAGDRMHLPVGKDEARFKDNGRRLDVKTTSELSTTERFKLALLAEGLTISDRALRHLNECNKGRALTPADYASTSGIILELDGHVWVNVPIADHNANFVTASRFVLDHDGSILVVRDSDIEVPAAFWLSPSYHTQVSVNGASYNNYVFTHADRARLAPIQGCGMVCKFCNIPYEDRYATKPVPNLLDALETALADPVQPARHVLISGGTPRLRDLHYLPEVYEAVMQRFPGLSVDIMMVPLDGLLDYKRLYALGVEQLSINLELFNRAIARHLMRQKYTQGIDYYLTALERAAEVFGGDAVRSMLMVGLEPLDDTLRGVEAIAQRGCTPVLSPFRPDPTTPLATTAPPTAQLLEEAFLRARDIAIQHGVTLGPRCLPCTHNTLTFGPPAGVSELSHPRPSMI
jgi:hypothetical protein